MTERYRDGQVRRALGALAELGWFPVPATAHEWRLHMRQTHSDLALLQILISFGHMGTERSVFQAEIARQLGVSRQRAATQIGKLAREGWIARSEDIPVRKVRAARPHRRGAFRHRADPYLAVLHALSATDPMARRSDSQRRALMSDATARMQAFMTRLASGRWEWECAGVTARESGAEAVLEAFLKRNPRLRRVMRAHGMRGFRSAASASAST